MHLTFLLALATPALANDSPDTAEGAATEEAPQAEVVDLEPAGPVTALTAEDALAVRNALREYKQQRLQVQRVSDMSLAATQYSATLTIVDTWSVFHGEQRLDALTYLDRVGAVDDLKTLEQRRRRNTTWGVAGAGAAVVGLGAFAAGLSQSTDLDATPAQASAGTAMLISGAALEVLGFGTAYYAFSRKRALRLYPSYTHSKDQAEDHVNAYNDQLARDLGLSAQHLLQLEQDD